jgi:hypothetical protein
MIYVRRKSTEAWPNDDFVREIEAPYLKPITNTEVKHKI